MVITQILHLPCFCGRLVADKVAGQSLLHNVDLPSRLAKDITFGSTHAVVPQGIQTDV